MIGANEIHLWDVELNQPAEQYAALAELLSADEVTRANAFYFERDRRRFTVARAVLRILVGNYLNQSPRAIAFTYHPLGKPALAGESSFQFNLSHSHQRAVYAFGLDHRLGVDLEYVRSVMDMDRIARQNFSARENTVFNGLPTPVKQRAFFNCWTRKEAYIKASGEGLSHALDSFDVTFLEGEPARLRWVRGQPGEPTRWTLSAFELDDAYVGAIATRQTVRRIVFRSWEMADNQSL
ncbi:MAG: 4'-phosphopantetheinyl transferase superfamily protein [Anaerolineaceae bacterium]|nr:4'-phosphopantetheinyl transferase superfamily protein [Anaerolineaceae bacterium]